MRFRSRDFVSTAETLIRAFVARPKESSPIGICTLLHFHVTVAKLPILDK